MARSIKQFFGFGIFFVAMGAAVLFGSQYVRYKNSPEYRAEKDMEKLVKQYAEDPYGGDTPEETLALFISALKQGNTDLAARYFILDKQEKWRNDLLEIKERGLLEEMVRDLENLKKKYPLVEGNNSRFIFEAYNETEELIMQADLSEGPNGKWKILDI